MNKKYIAILVLILFVQTMFFIDITRHKDDYKLLEKEANEFFEEYKASPEKYTVTEAKVRGEKAVIPKILDLTLDKMIPKTPYCIVYVNDEAVMEEMAQVMIKKVGYPPEKYFQIGAAIAINAGPRVVGVIFKAQRKE